jgi:hypothetical protein
MSKDFQSHELDELDALLRSRRHCYTIVQLQDVAKHGGYVPSLAIEGVAGHFRMSGHGEHAAPWVWGQTFDEACKVCDTVNLEKFGVDQMTAFKIVASTMGIPSHRDQPQEVAA